MRILLALFFTLFIANACAPSSASSNSQNFKNWLEDVRTEARATGISERTIKAALSDITPNDTVIKLDRKQPEGKHSFEGYIKRVLHDDRKSMGRSKYKEHKSLIHKIGGEYGVHPEVIIALWGVETIYGNFTGNFSIVRSLATLAYDGRRSEYFRKELFNALKIIDEGHISARNMKGSWAGALGQSQFMPSTYVAYAQDYNKDGKRDVWNTQEDVFASMANYLHKLGWDPKQPIAYKVSVPAGYSPEHSDIKKTKPIEEWRALGITLADGTPLPQNNYQASVINVGSDNSPPTYIVFDNYKYLLQWNRSRYFATSVSILADHIKQ